jgi:hypothetical protein
VKKNSNHILRSYLLLICFVAGQYLIWSHQHTYQESRSAYAKQQPKQAITENCKLCDAMHHTYMALSSPVCFPPVTVTTYAYKQVSYGFTSISLILSGGRSPPVA